MKNFSSLTLKMQLLEDYQENCVDEICNLLNICYNNNITKIGIINNSLIVITPI